jgi:dTDP-4-dehydrorhamnose 3,5-epimerase
MLAKMESAELSVPGVLVFTPRQHPDRRGVFMEWFRHEPVEATRGEPLPVRQANLSTSAAGVLRGIHAADNPPGQAKYVTVVRGAVIDYVVDLRPDSPTFGRWDSVRLDDVDHRALYIPEGVGHAFVALEDNSTVCYLASEVYAPDREFVVHPLDPAIGLELPEGLEVIVSERDGNAPTLAELIGAGRLTAPVTEAAS